MLISASELIRILERTGTSMLSMEVNSIFYYFTRDDELTGMKRLIYAADSDEQEVD